MDYSSIDKSKIICFDIETTGLDPFKDEILQLSIIDGNGAILFNEYIKPIHTVSWPEAQEINRISPEMVKDKNTIDFYKDRLDIIFGEAELIVGYNSIFFDSEFIISAGINISDKARFFDVMLKFAPIYGEWKEHLGDYKWQKLSTCAAYYGYQGSGNFHDSLEDAKATLHCFYEMIENR